MKPHRLFPAFVTLLFLIASTGCGDDSTTEPAGFSLQSYFSDEEALVIGEDPDPTLRMVGLEFEANTAELTAASRAILDKFDVVFEEYAGSSYVVEGHTDERGAADYNLRLSTMRAENVRTYLVMTVGGPSQSITAIGYGETEPLDPRSNEAAWAMNRRIEIRIESSE